MRELLHQLVGRAVVLGAIGLVAIGFSGAIAAAAGSTVGASWVAGDPPSVHYSAARCADFREYAPDAHTCEQAATEHHLQEVVDYRIAAGLVGAAVLAACAYLRRRSPRWLRTDRLPVAFDATVAAVVFGAAALWLVGYSIDQTVLGYHGVGFYLSGGIVAFAAAVLASTLFARKVRTAPQPQSR